MNKNERTLTLCPGCSLTVPDQGLDPAERFNASGECLKMFYDLTSWTIVQQDNRFIHQHAVDAYEAQHAGGKTRPITVSFGLIGLYLALEKGFTGRQVQLAHIKIGRTKWDWLLLEPPEHPAKLTVMDVLQVADREKEKMLMLWAGSVWQSWEPRHQWVREITAKVLFGDKNDCSQRF